jgi:antirestriction protein ArdC
MSYANARNGSVRADIYSEVTDRIITDLEAGVAPWAKPWVNGVAPMSALPVNHSTGRAYSGVNILILWGAAVTKGYQHPRWLTFKQASDLGGCVRKGEKGTMAVYADRFVPEAERARAESTGDDARSVAFLSGSSFSMSIKSTGSATSRSRLRCRKPSATN